MKAKLLCDGNDGSKSYKAGDEYEGDGEFIRRMLVNGLADPLDDAAQKIVASDHQRDRYRSAALTEQAKEIRPASEIPTLAGGADTAKRGKR